MASPQAQCKNCNGFSPADQFRLHYKFKMVVCPTCFSGRTEELKKKAEQKVEIVKPIGWDNDDEYLEKLSQMKKQELKTVKFSKIPGTNQVKCTCLKCEYSFKYDPFRKMPRSCPYCNYDIPKMDTFHLL